MRQASNICSYTRAERSRKRRLSRPLAGKSATEVPKREATTEELQRRQQERTTGEHRAIDSSLTPDEEKQHRRRAAKSAYLERKLAERKRSERTPSGRD
jgi:hypothetical protein